MEVFETLFRAKAAEWFVVKGNYAGFNGKYPNKDYETLYSKYSVGSLLELLYVMNHLSIPVCSICFKKAVFKGSRGYGQYCSRQCSFKDHARLSQCSVKASLAKKTNGTVVIRERVERCCQYCDATFSVAKSQRKDYCTPHRKLCPMCLMRHNNAGKCCSMACTNKLKQATNMKNAGVEHNLQIHSNRPNTIQYYLKRGFTQDESLQKVTERQTIDFSKYTTDQAVNHGLAYYKCENLTEYIDYLLDRINEHKVFQKPMLIIARYTNSFIERKYTVKRLYDILYKKAPEIVVYTLPKSQRSNYSYYYRTERGELLRSTNEYKFYKLLIANNIDYRLDRAYPKSKLRYDFYLPDYQCYIEIAGMMGTKAYREKMETKKTLFGAHILENYEDMLAIIEKLMTCNENQTD